MVVLTPTLLTTTRVSSIHDFTCAGKIAQMDFGGYILARSWDSVGTVSGSPKATLERSENDRSLPTFSHAPIPPDKIERSVDHLWL